MHADIVSSVTFIPGAQTLPTHGFSLSFPALTLHALTPASADGTTPAHVYCQIDETPHAANGDGVAEDDGQDWQMREVRIFVDAAERTSLVVFPGYALQETSARLLTRSRAPLQCPVRLFRPALVAPAERPAELFPPI